MMARPSYSRGTVLAALAAVGCLLALCPGCSKAVSAAAGGDETGSVLVAGIPHVRQKPDFCGEACVEMVLRKLGSDLDQDDVFDVSGTAPIEGRGSRAPELARAVAALGFEAGPVWYQVDTAKASERIDSLWREAHADLLKGVSSIVCMRTSATASAVEHFRLLVGYDAGKGEVIYHDPAVDNGTCLRMPLRQFKELWPLKYDAKRWTVVRFRLEGGRPAGRVHSAGRTDADYAQHLLALRARLPRGTFSMVIERPFVVVGDEDAATVKLRAERTVKWAVDHLKGLYFAKDPAAIMDVWLFKDKESYERNTLELIGREPHTPFGFCSSEDNALIMNIATGGGTLVHEIVHPFMAANFTGCPAWFNEGLGSLYEQCQDRDGQIWGLTNWRLAGLQEAIRDGRVPSFEELTGTTDDQFYRKDKGTNYAQARYLCYYLQVKGLLPKFYREFTANVADDPTGLQSLKRVLGESDMKAFQKKWETFVLGLRFP